MNATWQHLLEVLDEALNDLSTPTYKALYDAAMNVDAEQPGFIETRDPAALILRVITARDWR